MHSVHVFLRVSKIITRIKMGVSVRIELVEEFDTPVGECSDLGAIVIQQTSG